MVLIIKTIRNKVEHEAEMIFILNTTFTLSTGAVQKYGYAIF